MPDHATDSCAAAPRAAAASIAEVPLEAASWHGFAGLVGPGAARDLDRLAVRARARFDGRVMWHVNSTARGGGVAEMLRPLLSYFRGAGVDARWAVLQADEDFFRITKRIHNRLHGSPGDGLDLGEAERAHYEAVVAGGAAALRAQVGEGDLVVLHDPQTVGLAGPLRTSGARVVWQCHVGADHASDLTRSAARFLAPYARHARACVLSRAQYRWAAPDDVPVVVIPPSIDPLAPKNRHLSERDVDDVLAACGIIAGARHAPAGFIRRDGGAGHVRHPVRALPPAPIVPAAPLVVQVSRWDRLKDPRGVMDGFVDRVAPNSDAHLVLAGPEVTAVPDDAEGARVHREMAARWKLLDAGMRERVHLVSLPMEDEEENAIVVNALQRRARVVVQKSLAEGFGLTVAEAMWKGRPVVASRVGGIQDQIDNEVDGLLLDDPSDLRAFGDAVLRLLADRDLAERLGRTARRRVLDQYLAPRHLRQYVDLHDDVSPRADGVSPRAPALQAAR